MEISPEDVFPSSGDAAEPFMEKDSLVTSNGNDSPNEHSSDSDMDAVNGKTSSHTPASYHLIKWRRLRRHYADQYLEFFNTTQNDEAASTVSQDLAQSQIGAVTWTSNEKKQLFVALAKFGRHDLPRLSDTVGTKSEIETLAYLDAIHEATVDRQLFMDNTRNVSTADIPAATEIGPECEEALEKAADALNAYQEQYDIALGISGSGSEWLINRAVAESLDARYDEVGDNPDQGAGSHHTVGQVHGQGLPNSAVTSQQLFKFSVMLDLCEKYFMNHPTAASKPIWKILADKGQRPELTADLAQHMLVLVVDHLRQLLRVAIDVANARILSSATNDYKPTEKMSQADVEAALDILNLPEDAWDFWTGLARRNQLEVVTGSHTKGETRVQKIPYEKVEAILGQRRSKKRRRSMSVGSEISSTGSSRSIGTRESSGVESESDADAMDNIEESDIHVTSSEDDSDNSAQRRRREDSLSSAHPGVLEATNSAPRLSQREREIVLEEETDGYMEKVDQMARNIEEEKLWRILGKRKSDAIKEEDEHKLGPRPKTLRKSQDRLQHWSCNYVAEWEVFGLERVFGGASDEIPDTEANKEMSGKEDHGRDR